MGDRINNMGKMMSNPKQRNMYLLGAGAIVITLGLGFFIANKNKTQQVQSSAQLDTVPGSVKAIPGSSTNPDYIQSVKNTNEKQAAQAMQTGSSYVPTITSASVNNSASLDEIARRQQQEAEEKAKKEAEVKKAEEEERVRMEEEAKKQQALIESQKPVAATQATGVQTTQMAQAQVPAQPQAAKKYTDDDYMLIATLSSNWQYKKPTSEYDYAKQKMQTQNGVANFAGGNNATANVTNNNAVNTPPLAKAGTIYNGIIETAVNSDEDSPVLARIVSGPLKGTRLIGTFKNLGEKVALVFTTANIPNFDKTVKINAYAIDTNTSRTAMADDVDHHYFLRYGVLLATSFVTGYAQALQQNNQTTTVNPLTGAVISIPNGNQSAKDINRQALGQVGSQVATDVKQQYNNLKPTIYVNSGTAIGILLMDDLTGR